MVYRTMTISLPPEIEGPLSAQARRCGTTPESLALETLRKAFAVRDTDESAAQERTMYDRLASYIGVAEGTGESASANCGELFTDYLVEKKRRGHL
jgi:hypothetical protein